MYFGSVCVCVSDFFQPKYLCKRCVYVHVCEDMLAHVYACGSQRPRSRVFLHHSPFFSQTGQIPESPWDLSISRAGHTVCSHVDTEDPSSGSVPAKTALYPQSHLPRPDLMILIIFMPLVASMVDQFLSVSGGAIYIPRAAMTAQEGLPVRTYAFSFPVLMPRCKENHTLFSEVAYGPASHESSRSCS